MKVDVFGPNSMQTINFEETPYLDSFIAKITEANLKQEYKQDKLMLYLTMPNTPSILPHKKGKPINREYTLIGDEHIHKFLQERRIEKLDKLEGLTIILYDHINFPNDTGFIRGIRHIDNYKETLEKGSRP
ncbi:MAG: hypothetical protein ACLFN8_04525 [Candidatus Woesearchaeota archaeon]